jgi:hypothetical protein
MRRAVAVHKRGLVNDGKNRDELGEEHVQATIEEAGCQIGKFYVQCNIEELQGSATWSAGCYGGNSWCAHRVGKEAVDGLYSPLTVFNSSELVISCTVNRTAWPHRGNIILRRFRLRDPNMVPVPTISGHEALEEAFRVRPEQR